MDTQVRSWCRALRALAVLNVGLWLAVALAGYQAPAFPQVTAEPAGNDLYAAVLSRYVDGGDVRYGLLLTENPPEWRRYLQWLEEAAPESMTIDQRRAFWINAYNARVIAGVLERYPIDVGLELLRREGDVEIVVMK